MFLSIIPFIIASLLSGAHFMRAGSFNHALAGAAMQALHSNGHEVVFHDLYQERFDPVLPAEEIPRGAALDPVVKAHCDEITAADGIIIIHPNWWGQPPAILKGWADRIFRPQRWPVNSLRAVAARELRLVC